MYPVCNIRKSFGRQRHLNIHNLMAINWMCFIVSVRRKQRVALYIKFLFQPNKRYFIMRLSFIHWLIFFLFLSISSCETLPTDHEFSFIVWSNIALKKKIENVTLKHWIFYLNKHRRIYITFFYRLPLSECLLPY